MPGIEQQRGPEHAVQATAPWQAEGVSIAVELLAKVGAALA